MLSLFHSPCADLHEMLVKLREQNSSAKKALIVAMDSRVPYDQYSFDDRKDWIMVSMSGFFVILACVSSLLVCLQAGFIPGASPSLLLGGDLMTEAQVLKLPSVRYSDTMNQDHQINQTSCPICMEDYTDEIDLRCLPCGHLFHSECILPWLIERHATCPLCKQHVLVEEDTNSATWNHEPWSAYGLFLHQFLGFSNQGRTLVATEDQDSNLTDTIDDNNGNDNSQVI
jgi:Ring finger domain